MNDLVLHERTRELLEAYAGRPSHACLLIGPSGSGKAAAARYLAARLLGLSLEKLQNYPYITTIRPEDGKAIAIETVRRLQQFMTLKIPGTSALRRIVVIENAQTMTLEAQNAILKTLEEPPLDTVLLLTATSTESLLPTIQSRVRSLHIVPPSPAQIQVFFSERGFRAGDIDKALMVAGSLPGLIQALLSEEQNHPLFSATVEARALLQATSYERLVRVEALSKQRDLCLNMLAILSQMARMALMRSPEAVTKSTERWQRVLTASYAAEEQLRGYTSAKLVMTNLMLEI